MFWLAIIGLIVVAVWGSVLLRYTGLLGGCLSVLIVGCCLGHPFYHVALGPLPITADRLLLAVLLALFFLQCVLSRTGPKPVERGDLLLLALTATLCVSTFLHDWRQDAMQPAASLVFFYLMPVSLYLVARQVDFSVRAAAGLFATLALLGLYLALTSICEQQQLTACVFPRYIASPMHPEFLGRGRGPLLNPIGNGMFLCAGLFSSLMFWPRAGRISRVILVAVVVVYFAGIYCTLTRVVWLAAGIGTLAALVVALPRRQGLTFLAAAALLGCALLAAKWNDLNAFKRDRYVSVAEMSQSATLRPVLAYIALQMYVEHPIAGCGYHQYADSSRYYLGDRSTHLRLERGRGFVQHNVFLSLLVETGMIGAGLFLLWLMVVTAAGWQLWCSPTSHLAYRQTGLMVVLMVMSYAIMGMFHDLALIPMVNTLLFFMAGVLRSTHPSPVRQAVPSTEMQLGCSAGKLSVQGA